VRDKSELGEYYLDITQGDAHTSSKKKRILVVDIEEIEPVQGTRFHLKYYSTSGYFSKSKTVKTMVFDSKHLADIMDAYE
jgi:hypothetical protein